VSDRHRSRLPKPDRQEEHRYRKRRHEQQDFAEADGSELLSQLEPDDEQHRHPTGDDAASPQGDTHDDRCNNFAQEVDAEKRLTGSGLERRHEELCGRTVRNAR
jgi:hypothetical protein